MYVYELESRMVCCCCRRRQEHKSECGDGAALLAELVGVQRRSSSRGNLEGGRVAPPTPSREGWKWLRLLLLANSRGVVRVTRERKKEKEMLMEKFH